MREGDENWRERAEALLKEGTSFPPLGDRSYESLIDDIWDMSMGMQPKTIMAPILLHYFREAEKRGPQRELEALRLVARAAEWIAGEAQDVPAWVRNHLKEALSRLKQIQAKEA